MCLVSIIGGVNNAKREEAVLDLTLLINDSFVWFKPMQYP